MSEFRSSCCAHKLELVPFPACCEVWSIVATRARRTAVHAWETNQIKRARAEGAPKRTHSQARKDHIRTGALNSGVPALGFRQLLPPSESHRPGESDLSTQPGTRKPAIASSGPKRPKPLNPQIQNTMLLQPTLEATDPNPKWIQITNTFSPEP